MTVTLTYNVDLSRVRVEATGLGVAVTATVERSTDGVNWAVVRGGLDVPVTAGAMAPVDDYEFAADIANTYRVTSYATSTADTFTRTVADGWGTADTGQAWDTTLVDATVFDVDGAEGTVSVTDAQTAYWATLDVSLDDFDATVDVEYSAVATGAEVAGILAGRFVDDANFYFAWVLAGTDDSISVSIGMHDDAPGVVFDTVVTPYSNATTPRFRLRFAATGSTLRAKLWPVTDSEPADWDVEVTDTTHTAPGRIAFAAERNFGNTNVGLITTVDNLAVTHAPLQSGQDSADITPELDTVWIKNLSRPFLNRSVTVTNWSDVERPSRNGVFDIVGRTRPVAVTDVRLSRRYDLILTTPTVAEAEELDLCLASGDPILVHVPADCDVPGMYAVVGDVTISRREPRSPRRYLELPLVECAAPGPDVVGETNTWGAVIDAYATWADLIAANATWQDLLDGVADPEDVIVP